MRINQVREIARKQGIHTARMAKADIVRAIQRAEGNFDWFGSSLDGFFLRTRGGKGCSPNCVAREVTHGEEGVEGIGEDGVRKRGFLYRGIREAF